MRAAIGQFEHGSRNLLIARMFYRVTRGLMRESVHWVVYALANLGVLKSSRLLIYLNSTLGDLTISLSNQSRNEFLMEVASLHHTGVPIISWGFFDSITCYSPYRLQNNRIFCERERRTIFEQKVWSECKNGEGEWGFERKVWSECKSGEGERGETPHCRRVRLARSTLDDHAYGASRLLKTTVLQCNRLKVW